MGEAARFVELAKRYGAAVALHGFTLSVEAGELVVVVGPSGCGKSTLLRLVAGLEEPSSGEVHVGGRRVDRLPPQDRDVAMVFQSYALYPHMTVRGNIEFPLRMRGAPRAERRRRVDDVSALLEIESFLDRKPGALSGGQRQRVALARALVREPALFLLDEPLSNLDARLRSSVRQHIREVQRRLGVTTLYVTHDQTEAMTLGNRIVILNEGRIQTVASPGEAYDRPDNVFVATFLGAPPMNILTGRVEEAQIEIGGRALPLPPALRAALPSGPVAVGVRPEAFVPLDGGEGDGSAVLVATGRPETTENLGGEIQLRANVGDQEVALRLPARGRGAAGSFAAPIEELHFFSSADGRRIGP